jgi:DNA-binding beta-propeller fold protein YncE
MTKASPRGVSAGTAEDSPFGVVVTAGGRWAFVSVGTGLGVLRLPAGRPADVVHWISLPESTSGAALTPDGRYLLLAAGAGAVVVNVPAAEQGSSQAVLGELSVPGAGGPGTSSAIEVAVSADGRYAFASLEYADQIAVFDLAQAIASGFSANSYVGAIPMQVADVGLAVSPDGRWLYGTSEGKGPGTDVGTLSVISVPMAESDPVASLVARVTAGCEPVRVITSADGSVVWVTARASDALLAFSAGRLRTDPTHALLADVRVGEAPVGLALAKRGEPHGGGRLQPIRCSRQVREPCGRRCAGRARGSPGTGRLPARGPVPAGHGRRSRRRHGAGGELRLRPDWDRERRGAALAARQRTASAIFANGGAES